VFAVCGRPYFFPEEVNSMENPRAEKVAVVAEVRERLSSASATILTEYRGLSVKDLATLRRSLRDAGGEYKIYKNTLVRFAVQELGLTDLEGLLTGPTAITFVETDAVPVAKALRDFARVNPHLVVKGGLLGGNVLTPADANALAELPPRDVLLARLAGGLAAPLQQFAGLLQALPRNLAYGLKALIDLKGGVPEAAADAEAEAPVETASAEADADVSVETPAEGAESTDTPAEGAESTDTPAVAAETPAEATEAAEEPVAEASAEAEPGQNEAETTEVPEPEAAPAEDAAATDDEVLAAPQAQNREGAPENGN
jgi:large subunit ribosomal protein L10